MGWLFVDRIIFDLKLVLSEYFCIRFKIFLLVFKFLLINMF